MNLHIMTKGRVGNQETLRHIPPDWLGRTYIVCPMSEVDQHLNYHPSVMAEPHEMNYSQKMQWLIYLIASSGGKGVIMDDDLWWDKRPADKGKYLQRIQDVNELSRMWSDMEQHLEEVPLCGVQPRMMGQNQPLPYRDIGKVITIQGINTALFGTNKIPKVDYDPILADVHLCCYLLSRGLPNRLITDFVVNWKSSQAPGGCDYRTADMQREACNRVAEMYPHWATAVTKTPKTVKWLGDTRTDLRVQWKKLYKDAPNAGT